MNADWPVYRVAALEESQKLLVQDGNHGEYRPRKDEFVKDGTAFIRAADLGCGAVNFDSAEKINDVALQRIRKGIGKDFDTILSTKGTVGKIAFVPECSPQFVCSPQTSFWRSLDHDFLDPKFVYYELQSSHFLNQISSRKGETDMADYLSLTNQRRLNIRVPDITVQREVAKVLGSLDDKIELNRQINQTLERIAQAIFKSWFVDFEPVKAKIDAKAASRDPERAAMCAISGKSEPELDQLSPEHYQQLVVTAALFPDALVESELGLIPEGWEVMSVSDITSFAKGKVDVSALSIENYISTENMLENKGGVVNASSLPSASTVPSFSKGHVLISNIRPYFKKIWLARFEGGRSNDVLGFEAHEKDCIEFLYNLIYQDEFFDFMMRTSKGAKMPRGDKDAIAGWKFACAGHAVRSFFSEKVRPYYSYIESLNAEVQKLSHTRDALLPKLLSGDVGVC